MREYILPSYVEEVLSRLRQNGYQAYVVGGAVRDFLLGEETHDFDICTSARENVVDQLFSDKKKINPNGVKHGTITIRIAHQNVEITSFRHNPGEEPSLETDLRHRDLTINSIAYDGEFIDPYGGINNLQNRILRMVDPEAVIKEDPLRILRALRFQTKLGFQIDDATKEAMIRHASLLREVATERILAELRIILLHPKIDVVLQEYQDIFTVLFPDLKPTVGFDQHTRWHAHTLYVHISHVVANVPPDFTLRLAALLHDNGKIKTVTREDLPDGGYCYHFYGHPAVSAAMAETEFIRHHLPLLETSQTLFLIRYHDIHIGTSKHSVRKMLQHCLEADGIAPLEILRKLLYLQAADHADHTKFVPIEEDHIMAIAEEIVRNQEAFSLKDLKVNGHDMRRLGLRGPDIGSALNQLLELVMADQLPNDHDILMDYVRQQYKK
ncbi:MAG: CCA tRNA nucleotidyltransferase [Bacilli bacterium]|nr:CCA tRNA nucleotidyltransferase [Bacilli bacterium]